MLQIQLFTKQCDIYNREDGLSLQVYRWKSNNEGGLGEHRK